MARKVERYDINLAGYLGATMHFLARHHGGLLLLTGAAMENGSLPDDDRRLAQIAKSTLQ